MLQHLTCTSAPSSEIFNRFRYRAVLSRQLIPTTNARLHLTPCPYSSTGLHSQVPQKCSSYFPYLRTLTWTSRLRYTAKNCPLCPSLRSLLLSSFYAVAWQDDTTELKEFLHVFCLSFFFSTIFDVFDPQAHTGIASSASCIAPRWPSTKDNPTVWLCYHVGGGVLHLSHLNMDTISLLMIGMVCCNPAKHLSLWKWKFCVLPDTYVIEGLVQGTVLDSQTQQKNSNNVFLFKTSRKHVFDFCKKK